MQVIVIIIICLISLTSCEKLNFRPNSSCECSNTEIKKIVTKETFSEKEEYYYIFWKNYFISQNQWDSQEFYNKIFVVDMMFHNWNAGTSCKIVYFYINDWAAIKCNDSFIIKLKSEKSAYHHLNIPRDTLLDSEWLSFCIRNNIAFSEVLRINPNISLMFESCKEAYNYLKKESGYEVLDNYRLNFYVPGRTPRVNGYPYLFASGQINFEENKCVSGHMNLVTGEWNISVGPCFY